MHKNCVTEYYRILRAIFPLNTYYEGKFLREFKTSLIEYSESHSCSFDDLVEQFGTPQEVLHEYLDTQDLLNVSEKLQKSRNRNMVFIFCLFALILALLIYSFFLYDLSIKVEQSIPTEFETTIETLIDEEN